MPMSTDQTAEIGSILRKLIQSQREKAPMTVVHTTCTTNTLELTQRLSRVISACSEKCLVVSSKKEDSIQLTKRFIHHGTARLVYGLESDRTHFPSDVIECERMTWVSHQDISEVEGGLVLSMDMPSLENEPNFMLDVVILNNIIGMTWHEFEQLQSLGKRIVVITTSEASPSPHMNILDVLMLRCPDAIFINALHNIEPPEVETAHVEGRLGWSTKTNVVSTNFSKEIRRGVERLKHRALSSVCIDTLKEDTRHIKLAHLMAHTAQQLVRTQAYVQQGPRRVKLSPAKITICCGTKQHMHMVRHHLSQDMQGICVITRDQDIPKTTQMFLTHYDTAQQDAHPANIRALSGVLSRKHILSLVFWEEPARRKSLSRGAHKTHTTKTILKALAQV